MRCPDCNKFVSNEEQEPDEAEIEVDDDGNITVQVRIVNVCADCSAELAEANLDMTADAQSEVEEHKKECLDAAFSVEQTSSERESRSEGKGRGMKTFYGAAVHYKVTCDKCDEEVCQGDVSDFVQASSMDSLV